MGSQKREEPGPAWHQEAFRKLSRLDFEALPPEKRQVVEAHLEALARELFHG